MPTGDTQRGNVVKDMSMSVDGYVTAAAVMGRGTFEFVDGPNGWQGDLGYGAERDQTAPLPVVVITNRVPDKVQLADRLMFATDGLQAGLDRAHEHANGKDVVMGGGALAHSYLEAGLVDVLILHLAPVVLGGGTPLFPSGSTTRRRLELRHRSPRRPPSTSPTES